MATSTSAGVVADSQIQIDAVVPAHNEAPTVGRVIAAVLESGVFRRVLCVDDGSSDATAELARGAGAEVLSLTPNGGKAEAMLAGVARLDAQARGLGDLPAGAIAFFDADLTTLTPAHVRLMVEHFDLGFDQVCGLRDYGMLNLLQTLAPVMTGERIVRRCVVDRVPETCWVGYAIETVINFVVDDEGGKTCLVPLQGLDFRLKQAKVGFFRGWLQHLAMARQMADARASLEASGGASCAIVPRKLGD